MINWFNSLSEEARIAVVVACIPGLFIFSIGLAITFLRIIWLLLGLN